MTVTSSSTDKRGLLANVAAFRALWPAPMLLALGCNASSAQPPVSSTAPAACAAPEPAPAAPAPPASARPYDLDADLQARIKLARAQFHSDVPAEVVGDVFALVGAPRCPAFGAAVRHVRDATLALLHDRMDRRATSAVTVYVFCDEAAYEGYCQLRLGGSCPSPLGFYERSTREVFAEIGPGIGTLTHEIVHPMFEADFPGAPEWLEEGVASLFEAPVLSAPGEIHGQDNWRLPLLATALRSPAKRHEASLAATVAMGDAEFREGDVDAHYAAARYVCMWLDERGWLWPMVREMRDAIGREGGAGGTGAAGAAESAFREVTKMTTGDAERAWRGWVLARAKG